MSSRCIFWQKFLTHPKRKLIYNLLIFAENLAITAPPKDKMAKIGSVVRLTCGVSKMGVTEVTIQWSRYYQPIIPNSRITIGKNGQDVSYINIKGVQFSDAGLYSCTVSTPLGSISSKSSTALAILKVQGTLFHAVMPFSIG